MLTITQAMCEVFSQQKPYYQVLNATQHSEMSQCDLSKEDVIDMDDESFLRIEMKMILNL